MNSGWRRSWGGCDLWLMGELEPCQSEAPHSLPHPWNAHPAEPARSGGHLQGLSLERAVWCWDHLDWIPNWAQCRPLYKPVRFWQTDAGICSSCTQDRGRDGWMASPPRWTWVWASSGRWWRMGKPGVLQSMGSQKVRHSWAAEQHTPRQALQVSPLAYYSCSCLSAGDCHFLRSLPVRGPVSTSIWGAPEWVCKPAL